MEIQVGICPKQEANFRHLLRCNPLNKKKLGFYSSLFLQTTAQSPISSDISELHRVLSLTTAAHSQLDPLAWFMHFLMLIFHCLGKGTTWKNSNQGAAPPGWEMLCCQPSPGWVFCVFNPTPTYFTWSRASLVFIPSPGHTWAPGWVCQLHPKSKGNPTP